MCSRSLDQKLPISVPNLVLHILLGHYLNQVMFLSALKGIMPWNHFCDVHQLVSNLFNLIWVLVYSLQVLHNYLIDLTNFESLSLSRITYCQMYYTMLTMWNRSICWIQMCINTEINIMKQVVLLHNQFW